MGGVIANNSELRPYADIPPKNGLTKYRRNVHTNEVVLENLFVCQLLRFICKKDYENFTH